MQQMEEDLRYMSMSRCFMNGLQEKRSGTSSLQSDVLTSVTNLLDRVMKTAFLNFKCGRASGYNERTSTETQA